jgi:hypothetical protein
MNSFHESLYNIYDSYTSRPRCCGLGFLRNTKAPLLGLTLYTYTGWIDSYSIVEVELYTE